MAHVLKKVKLPALLEEESILRMLSHKCLTFSKVLAMKTLRGRSSILVYAQFLFLMSHLSAGPSVWLLPQ